MAAVLELQPEALYRQSHLTDRLRAVPTVEEVLKYDVEIDFNDVSRRGDQLSRLVENARTDLSIDPNTDTSKIEHDIESILLADAIELDDFAHLFVNELMPEYEGIPGTCGLTGVRYNNAVPGDLGLVLFKTRIKRGRNTLAKAFRKSHITPKTAEEMIAEYENNPLDDDKHPYQLEPESKTVRYKMGDTSATRALLENETGVEHMRAWIYLHPELEVVAEEEKDKPTYKAHHMQVRYRGVVREVQLMTVEAEIVSIADGYHCDEKNDVVAHLRR